jgi:hypothetical protein
MAFVGHNQLQLIVHVLTFDFTLLKEKMMSNKIRKGVGITCMEKLSSQKSMAWKL